MSFEQQISMALAELPIGRFVTPPLDSWSAILSVHRQRAGLSLRMRMKLQAVTEHGAFRIDKYGDHVIARMYLLGYEGKDSHVYWLREDVGTLWPSGDQPPAELVARVKALAWNDYRVSARHLANEQIAKPATVVALPTPQQLRLVHEEADVLRELRECQQALATSQANLARAQERWLLTVEHHRAALRRLGVEDRGEDSAIAPV